MPNNYKKDMATIEIPQHLVDSTVALMKEEQELLQSENFENKQGKKRKSKVLSLRPFLALAATVLVVLSSVFLFLKTNSNIILTKLNADTFVKQVELKDGNLRFDEDQTISQDFSQSFAGGNTDSAALPIEEYEEYLGKKVVANYLPKGMSQAHFSGKIISASEKVVSDRGYIEYTDESGTRRIVLSISKTSMHADTMEGYLENSSIRGVKLYLAKLPSDGGWYASFADVYAVYTVSATDISQKDFILFLNGIIN